MSSPMKNDTVCKERASNIFLKEREQYYEIQDLKAQLQDKNIAISDLKKLTEKCKGKSIETKFDKPSVVRQPNAQRIPKPSVLGKSTPFSYFLERKSFSKTKSVPKTNVSERIIYKTNVSRPPLKSTQMKDKVVPNNSQVKDKKTKVEDHPRISSISNKTKSVTACNDSLKSKTLNVNDIVQLILFIVDSGCTKHMTGNLKLLCNFVEKYMGTIRFGNDQFAPILGYRDLLQGNIMINRVYYVEGLNHNLFLVGQFCDANLEVAFRKSTYFVRDLQGNDLLTAWLWHRRLSHLNFDYINLLLKKDIVIGLPKLKYVKDQLCSSCKVSKAKRSSFKIKVVPSSKGRLNLLHMDLCGPMRVASINGKKYILVIVDDCFRYTWTLFLRSKEETLEVLKDFLTMIQQNLQALVNSVRTDRGTEFLSKTLNEFFKEERMSIKLLLLEHLNRTAEAIAYACYTQDRSYIITSHEKMAYHIINDKKPSIRHLHIFGCTCYLTKDGENLDKMKEKRDPCILVGYFTQSKGYHVYNKRTRLIVESIHLRFDEIKEMSETSVDNNNSGLVLQRQKASDYDNSGPAPKLQNVSPSADTTGPSQQEFDLLFGPLYDEFFNVGTLSVNNSSSPIDNSKQQDTPPITNIQSSTEPTTPTNVNAKENNDNQVEDAQF
ncbi:retrovirus-related pol polyprotein from transposon TNT 1-94 [Tanacetum coccineum]